MSKKLFLCVICVCATASLVLAQDTSVNVSSFSVPELGDIPVIDGDISDGAWANIPWMDVDKDGDPPGNPAPPEAGNLDVQMKAAWDDETNALYFAFHVVDDVFINEYGRGSSAGTGGWQHESLELVINAENTGSSADGEGSDHHAQYTFQFPNTIDDQPIGMGDLDVSTDLISLPIFEGIDGHFAGESPTFDIDNDYVESAGMIRATRAGEPAWEGSPVEFYIEFKIVPFSILKGSLDAPENVLKDLEALDVIGIDPCMNDSDSFGGAREWRVNLSGTGAGWNSSAELVGMILEASQTPVADWTLY